MYEASLLVSFLVFCVGLVVVAIAALGYCGLVWAGASLVREGIRTRNIKKLGEGTLCLGIMGSAALLVLAALIVPELFY